MRLCAALVFLVAFASFARADDSPELAAAVALFDSRRVPEARERLAALVGKEPANVRALWYLGRCDLKMRRLDEAETVLGKASALAPADARVLADYGNACLTRAAGLGVSFSAIGSARRGRDALERAVALDPARVAYREGLIQFYTRAPLVAGGDFSRAYAHIAEIAKLDPARSAVIKANVLCSEKRYDEASAACEEHLRSDPDNYLALYTLGRIASETGRGLTRGEQALRRCLELTPRAEEPDHAGAHYRLGLIAEKDNRPDDARREYRACLDLEPDNAKASDALARLK